MMSGTHTDPYDLLMTSADQLDQTAVIYFSMAEKLICTAASASVKEDASLSGLAFQLNAFFSYVMELQKMTIRKRTVIMCLGDGNDKYDIYYERFKKNRNALKHQVKKNIKLIKTYYWFYSDMQLVIEQLEDLLHVLKKNLFIYPAYQPAAPVPAPPLLKINTVTKINT